MGLLSLTLPTIGQPNSTEDTDIRNALSSIQTLVNGNIDSANVAAASLPFSKLTPKIVYGVVNGAAGGVLVAGSGDWSAVRNSAGQYTITFSPAFGSAPIVTCTQSVGGPGTACTISTPVAGSFSASTYTSAGAIPTDANVHFVAVGVR